MNEFANLHNTKTDNQEIMALSEFIKKLNANKIFKFISSVRLAVPLMLTLAVCVAYGTIVESNYNAEYAAMAIYKSTPFGLLLILLWINIFAATISRIPFKIHHTGFVITHIGLLTLLIGGYTTNNQGMDGQLIIPEHQSSSTVVLPNLMIAYQMEGARSSQSLKIKKTLFEKDEKDLQDINDEVGHLFKVKKYTPFAKIEKEYIEDPKSEQDQVAVSFILKNNFFNVNEWLHSVDNPQMKMGPATLKIVKTNDLDQQFGLSPQQVSPKRELKPVVKNLQTGSFLSITMAQSSDIEKKISLADLVRKPQTYNGITIRLIRKYDRAVVTANKMVEGPADTPENPALELQVEKNGKTIREVLYAKFAGFSLNQKGIFGYKFSYETSGGPGLVAEHDLDESVTPAQAAMKGDNTVIFSVDPKVKKKSRVTLVKNNEVVMSEVLEEGQSMQTPWMGMQIFLGSVRMGAVQNINARPINPEKSNDLPPSALLVSTSNQGDFWLAEGEEKNVTFGDKNAVIYFGRQTLDLPFSLTLNKFTKTDYPGTTTPMSFESLVEIEKTGIAHKISMNEPLKLNGYTVYQASYSVTPEQTLSIFSVNGDPGRPLKYAGSLILAIGIMILTLMKSRVWKNYAQRKNAKA